MDTKQILLVEDNDILSKTLTRYLAGLGLQVTTASTVAEARRLLLSNAFDVLVADMNLPDDCGLELVSQLTDSPIPVIAMTADDPRNYRARASRAGAAAFLEKPFSLKHFKRILNCLLAGRRCLPECSIVRLWQAIPATPDEEPATGLEDCFPARNSGHFPG